MNYLTKQSMEANKGTFHETKGKERTVPLPVTLLTPGFPLTAVGSSFIILIVL